ncbi:DUF6367 family protein [Roseisolibacter sp. H3M3-2]|uniref:DUF6367 family protein n=1 Tax=Roseisolibacter sp. H3M3-2 TaxID=3031323 RepID=UPI0023DBC5A5|nr:DUF6367 family protein [Roseisolibacter sp. H3M3-2]MDF1501807.1 DUF6367 family protein [Roseisolibacter sp. H3M3-2]
MIRLTDLLPADYVIIEVDGPVCQSAPYPIMEALGWRDVPGHSGWAYRVDQANPGNRVRRHVHICRSKHTSAKGRQVSWNDDGSRHDKKSFDEKLGGLGAAKQIAREILGSPDHLVFEIVHDADRAGRILVEHAEDVAGQEHVVVLRARLRLDRAP